MSEEKDGDSVEMKEKTANTSSCCKSKLNLLCSCNAHGSVKIAFLFTRALFVLDIDFFCVLYFLLKLF